MMNMITAELITPTCAGWRTGPAALDLAVDHHAHDQRIGPPPRPRLVGVNTAIDAAQDDHSGISSAQLAWAAPGKAQRPSPSFLPQPLILQYTHTKPSAPGPMRMPGQPGNEQFANRHLGAHPKESLGWRAE